MRKTIKVMALLVILCMALSIFMVGCGGKTTEQPSQSATQTTAEQKPTEAPKAKDVTIRYGLWGSQEELKIQQENAADAEKAFPGLKIEVQPYPDSETFWNKLPAEIAAKTAPDVVKLTNEGYYEYVAKGVFVPIDNEVKEAGVDLSTYTDSAKGIWTVDGKLYGIPLSVAPAMFIINTDMWKAAGLGEYPKTWAEVKEAAKKLTKNGVYGICINDHPYHMTNYALSFGGGWANGKTINAEGNVKALEFIADMYKEKLAVTPKQAGFGWDGEVIANKKAAMSTGGWWYIGYLKDAAPDLKYDIIPIPEGTTKGCTMHSDAIVVLKDAVDKLSAVKAAAYLTRGDAQNKLMEGVGSNPAITSLSAKYYEKNPQTKSTEASIQYAKDFGYPADTKKFNDELVKVMDEKIYKDSSKSVKELLDELQKAFNP